MIKRIPILCIVMFTIVIISSCGPQITPCGCKNSNDSDYQKRCEKWLIGAPHDEYVRFKSEMDNCSKKDEVESENDPAPDAGESLNNAIDNTPKENSSVPRIETEVNEDVNQGTWTLEDKKQWVGNCIAGVNATSLSKMTFSFKKDYCSCMFEKLTIKYPNKLDNVNTGIAKEFAKECFTEALK